MTEQEIAKEPEAHVPASEEGRLPFPEPSLVARRANASHYIYRDG